MHFVAPKKVKNVKWFSPSYKGQQAQPKSRDTVEVLDLHIASSLYTNNT